MTAAAAPAREDEGPSVTTLELFFDLAFVFAMTQVTILLADDPTWGSVLRGMLVLAALWWAWEAYAWLTNTLDPEEGAVRLAVFASTGAMLIVALATPSAFGSEALVFGVAYFLVRALHIVLYTIASRGDPELFAAVYRDGFPSSDEELEAKGVVRHTLLFRRSCRTSWLRWDIE